MRRSRVRLLVALLALWFALAGATQAQGYHTDERFGFKLKAPKAWTEIPRKAGEEWLVAKYLSDRSYFYTDKGTGWTHEFQPELMVIAFVHQVVEDDETDVEEKSDDDGVEITFRFKNPYKDYEDYLDRNYSGGGFYISSKKKEKRGDLEVTKLEIKVEKLARDGPKRIVTWVYHGEDVDFAVQMEVLEDSFKKLKRTISSVHKSFKFIPRTKGALPTDAATSTGWITISSMDRGTPSDRRDARIESELSLRKGALANLPEDWESKQMGSFFVLYHVDEKYAKKVVSHAEAVLRWLDESFPMVGEGEYVRSPILRICKDSDEQRSFQEGRGSEGWFGTGIEIVTCKDDGGLMDWNFDWVNSSVMSIWFQDRDRDLYWALPEWIDYGLREYVQGMRSKGKKVQSFVDGWDRDELRNLVRQGKATRPRDLVRMTRADFREGGVFDRMREAEALTRFFLSDAARKRSATKDVLPKYIENLAAVVEEMDDDLGGSTKAPKTEAEEEAQYKARSERWKKKERDIVEETWRRTFGDWSDKDWDRFEKAYFDTIG